MVRMLHVAEDVNEQLPSAWLQPPGKLLQKQLVILHVLEHLNGKDPVEGARLESVKGTDVPSEHLQVCDSSLLGLSHYMISLCGRVRQRSDLRIGKPLREEQRERAPTAAQVQDSHPVLNA